MRVYSNQAISFFDNKIDTAPVVLDHSYGQNGFHIKSQAVFYYGKKRNGGKSFGEDHVLVLQFMRYFCQHWGNRNCSLILAQSFVYTERNSKINPTFH